ncbi:MULTISPECIES: helix-turn-helix domain-containing protein [Oscillibacter]|uniref:helix-turn-helix domain-containing protein n=1 Tax=unclassified Oscillibacter TaxID=2629304 RepID=UPI0025EB66CC|nr:MULTISPECIES: helix-turn-helix transcriptional regulator [unclassified Oscillibacter]
MTVGERITQLREQRGYTTNKLANESGLSQSFVRAVELGEKGITVVNLEYLCKVLDVSLQDFFSYTGSEVRGELTALVSELTQEQQAALCAFLKTM